MRETADRMLAQIREYIAKMPRKSRIQIAILGAVVVTLAIITVSLLTRTNWVVVPGTSDPAVGPEVYAALNEMGVPTKVEGNAVLVPEERLGDAQMRLREQGLLGTPDFSLDIMAGATGFGTTTEHARQLYDMQRGEHIRIQLLQMREIANALVIVNSGETSPFRVQNNAKQATASLMLTLTGGRLTQLVADSIGEIVRGAVPGIEYSNISIVDSEGTHYPVGDVSRTLDFETVLEQRILHENRLIVTLKQNVEQFLAPIYGVSNIQVLPSVKLNWDTATTNSVEFAPPVPGELDGMIRSMEEIHEFSRRWDDAEGVPGTDSNNMGTVEYPWGPLDARDEFRRTAISRNYEMNETIRSIEHAEGIIEDLQIGVLINSDVVEADYTEEITDLVAKAIGVGPASISVQQIPFIEDTSLQDMIDAMEAQAASERNRALLENILMYVVILTLGVMFMLLIRSVVRAVRPPPEPEPMLVAAGPGVVDYMVDDETSEEKEYEEIDLTAKSAGLEQIERFIDKDAASVAQLLRNWLSDE